MSGFGLLIALDKSKCMLYFNYNTILWKGGACKMPTKLTLGEFFKQKRTGLKKTLRQFCAENKLDPGNISKLERGLMAPPQGSDKLGGVCRLPAHKKKAPMTGIHLSILPILNQDAYLKSCSKMRLLPHACLFCSGHCEARKLSEKNSTSWSS